MTGLVGATHEAVWCKVLRSTRRSRDEIYQIDSAIQHEMVNGSVNHACDKEAGPHVLPFDAGAYRNAFTNNVQICCVW